jgi:hypothetical protein
MGEKVARSGLHLRVISFWLQCEKQIAMGQTQS